MDKKELLSGWISFLKNNQIVGTISDPKTGKLNYNKSVTANDISRYLKLTHKFSDATVDNAIATVLHNKPVQQQISNDTPQQKKFDTTNATDAKVKSPSATSASGGKVAGQLSATPDAIRKRQSRLAATQQSQQGAAAFSKMSSQLGKSSTNEAITDMPSIELSEQDVEHIFDLLLKHHTEQPAAPKVDRTQLFNQIKRSIRDQLSPVQRAALWRALTND